MPLPIVSLDSDFTVYADVAMADTYLDAASHADAWRALTDDDAKARYLVTATRTLDRQLWRGTKVVSDQPLAWPRENTGITPDPITDANDLPVDIQNASIEMALALIDTDVQSEANTIQKLSSLSAGSVSLTYYHGADGVPRRFPTIIQELVRPYLAGSSPTLAGVATGTDGETVTKDDFGLVRGF